MRGSAVRCLLLYLGLVEALSAQAIDLRLRTESTDAPIVGAIVRLLGDRGVVSAGLTDGSGHILIHAPQSGTYRLKIDRIGESGVMSDPIVLEAGQTARKVIALGSHPIRLPTIVVRAGSPCRVPGPQGETAQTVWAEVEKALTAHQITQALGLQLYVRRITREFDQRGRQQREWTSGSGVSRESPFRALSPIELLRRGFVFNVPDGAVFAAPDAALMLSDEFTATHCFFAREGDGGLAGLDFQPLVGRRVPEVTGTLWFDRVTIQLRYMEFLYTGLGGALRNAPLGGRIAFSVLPDGLWIVDAWHIRMPRLDPRRRLAGYTEEGGRAQLTRDSTRIVHHSIVAGRAWDSTLSRGLAGAVARIRGRPDSVLADSSGAFRLELPVAGPQAVELTHPKLGLLGDSTSRAVLLSLGDTSYVSFGIPSLATFIRKFCGGSAKAGRVNLVGRVIRQEGASTKGLEVSAMNQGSLGLSPISGVRSRYADKEGLYSLCGVPTNRTVTVLLRQGAKWLVELPVAVGTESQWVDLKPSPPP